MWWWQKKPVVILPQSLWEETLQGLATRGRGERETACIWAGRRERKRWYVTKVFFLDDLPGTYSHSHQHVTSKETASHLFRLLRNEKLQIVVDVHTHPSGWTDLSPTDKAHPIEYRRGLLAVVIPDFAITKVSLECSGIHEYLGSNEWARLTRRQISKRFLQEG